MDKITSKFLTIERDAQETVQAILQEKTVLRQEAEAKLAARVKRLEAEAESEIARQNRNAEAELARRFMEIEAGFAMQTERFVRKAEENKQSWREKIFHEILG